MTFREFKTAAFKISQEEFQSDFLHPLEHAIQRANFQEQKLKRLIAMGRAVELETARRRVNSWVRQLERLQVKRQRLKNTKAGVFVGATSRLKPRVASCSQL